MSADTTAMHVPLGAGLPSGPPAPPLLDPAGPERILGGADPLTGPVVPAADTLYGPRGALLLGEHGPLLVAQRSAELGEVHETGRNGLHGGVAGLDAGEEPMGPRGRMSRCAR